MNDLFIRTLILGRDGKFRDVSSMVGGGGGGGGGFESTGAADDVLGAD